MAGQLPSFVKSTMEDRPRKKVRAGLAAVLTPGAPSLTDDIDSYNFVVQHRGHGDSKVTARVAYRGRLFSRQQSDSFRPKTIRQTQTNFLFAHGNQFTE